jgi:hypothetical protein
VVKFSKIFISIQNVESNKVVKFSKTHRAEMEGPPIALFQVVGSVFQTTEVNAAHESEHVGGFVHQNLAAATDESSLTTRETFLAVKLQIVPGEAETPYPIPKMMPVQRQNSMQDQDRDPPWKWPEGRIRRWEAFGSETRECPWSESAGDRDRGFFES